MSDVLRVLGYGLLAAASPTALLATLVVLGSGRGRPAGIAFAAAFVLGQSVAFLIGFLIGSAITPPSNDTASSVATFLELRPGSRCSPSPGGSGHAEGGDQLAARRGPRRCSQGSPT